jgi:hypothetical protein
VTAEGHWWGIDTGRYRQRALFEKWRIQCNIALLYCMFSVCRSIINQFIIIVVVVINRSIRARDDGTGSWCEAKEMTTNYMCWCVKKGVSVCVMCGGYNTVYEMMKLKVQHNNTTVFNNYEQDDRKKKKKKKKNTKINKRRYPPLPPPHTIQYTQ